MQAETLSHSITEASGCYVDVQDIRVCPLVNKILMVELQLTTLHHIVHLLMYPLLTLAFIKRLEA